MLKKILIIAILFVGLPSTAQKFVFGVKGGVNWNTIGTLYHIGTANGGGSNLTPSDDTYYEADQAMGTQFGGFVMFEWKRLLIRPEINFSTRKNEYPLALETSFWEQKSTDLALLLGVRVWEPIKIYAGPSFNSISEMTMDTGEAPILFEDSSTNIQAGLMVDFEWFGLDIRYEYGLETIPEQRVDILRSKYGTNVARLLEYNQSTIYLTAHINIFRIYTGQGGRKPKAKWRNKNCF